MKRIIVLDSGPLGLMLQRQGIARADACRTWMEQRIDAGADIMVPEIADYEVRRELLRLGASAAIANLDTVIATQKYLPLTTQAMRLAAELWAQARAAGRPTADPHALDGDVILAAQALTSGFDVADVVVASSNVVHLAQFVPAEIWDRI